MPRLFFELIQDGGNLEHAAVQGDQEPQILKQLHSFIRSDRQVPIDKLKMMKPEYESHIDNYVTFVSAWSGGVDGKTIEELDAWCKTKQFRRRIGGQVLGALADESFTDKPLYVIGVCKMLYACDAKYTRNGLDVKMVTVSDIQQTVTKPCLKDIVVKAKELQQFGREVFEAQRKLTNFDWTKHIGWLDENCMAVIHNKDKAFPFKTVHQVGECFFAKVQEIVGETIVGRPVGWPTEVTMPTAPKAKNVAPALREMSADSLKVDVSVELNAKGFKVGAEVQPKCKSDTKSRFRLLELFKSSATATLKRLSDSTEGDHANVSCSFSELLANYSVLESTKEEPSTCQTHLSSSAFLFLSHRHVGQCVMGLLLDMHLKCNYACMP